MYRECPPALLKTPRKSSTPIVSPDTTPVGVPDTARIDVEVPDDNTSVLTNSTTKSFRPDVVKKKTPREEIKSIPDKEEYEEIDEMEEIAETEEIAEKRYVTNQDKPTGLYQHWTDNKKEAREDDYYTPVLSVLNIFEFLIDKGFLDPSHLVFDPMCGGGVIIGVAESMKISAIGRDKYSMEVSHDYLIDPLPEPRPDIIITNFAFSVKHEAVEKAIIDGIPICVLLPIQILQTKTCNLLKQVGFFIVFPCYSMSFKRKDGKTCSIGPVGWFLFNFETTDEMAGQESYKSFMLFKGMFKVYEKHEVEDDDV